MKQESTPSGKVKYQVFAIGLAFLILLQGAFKYLTYEATQWDMRFENIAAPVVIAWCCERYAQFKLNLHFHWLGTGRREFRLFFLSLSVWLTALWLAWPEILTSHSAIRFFSNAGVLYLFAGALFEITNLIKVEYK